MFAIPHYICASVILTPNKLSYTIDPLHTLRKKQFDKRNSLRSNL